MSKDEVVRIPVSELNQLLICKLCLGYFQDAHTITECMHTFCRSCIWTYFDRRDDGRSIPCPRCNTDIGFYHIAITKIIFDRNIQSIVDKIFPADVGDSRLIQQQLQQQVSGTYAGPVDQSAMEFTVKTIPDEQCDEVTRLPSIPKPSFKGKFDVTVKKIQKFVFARLDDGVQSTVTGADGIEVLFDGAVLDPKSDLAKFHPYLSPRDGTTEDGSEQGGSTNNTLILHYRRKLQS
eukprot:gene16231-11616_t